jgi:hypothetical protein
MGSAPQPQHWAEPLHGVMERLSGQIHFGDGLGADDFEFLLTQISSNDSNLKKFMFVCRNGNAESIDLLYVSIQLDLQDF